MPLPFDKMQRQGEVRVKPRKIIYYYRNKHGKVVSLDEDVAFEQHTLHSEFLGSSEDLERTGFNWGEKIGEHLKANVVNPKGPPDKRKITNYPQKMKGNIDIDALREEIKQEVKQELKESYAKQEGKTKKTRRSPSKA